MEAELGDRLGSVARVILAQYRVATMDAEYSRDDETVDVHASEGALVRQRRLWAAAEDGGGLDRGLAARAGA